MILLCSLNLLPSKGRAADTEVDEVDEFEQIETPNAEEHQALSEIETSVLICASISGRCTLTTTRVPSLRVASCTCPMLAVAKGISLKSLKRADFRKRIKAGRDIVSTEMLYPLFQGYDSVMVKANVEIGGEDQLLNLLAGRKIQSIILCKNLLSSSIENVFADSFNLPKTKG